MSDSFGARKVGRVYEGGKFYATPAAAVPANAIFMPNPSGSAQFGVAEYPVATGDLGAFSYVGTFAFPAPTGWTSVDGQAIYYNPSSAATGEILAETTTGAIPIGYEVVRPDIPAGQIYVDLQRS